MHSHHNMQIRYEAKEKDLKRLHRPMNLKKKLWFIFK
jgi:hypothetical protein